MRNMTKAMALSAILGGAVFATTPAQAWWGGPGWGGPWGGWPGSRSNYMDDWMDGTGWGDMTFSTSMGGRGYGRGYGRDYGYYGYPYGGYPYGGYGGYPYGGYPYGGWGGPWHGPYMGGPWGYAAPQARPSTEAQTNEQPAAPAN